MRIGVVLLVAALAAAFAAAPATADDKSSPAGSSNATDLHLPPLVPGEIREVKTYDDGVLVYGWIPQEYADSFGGVGTQNASPCVGAVCMQIVGSGLHINTWNTQAINPGVTCSWASWLMNANVVHESDVVCAGPGVFFSDWTPNRNFPTGLACNTWFTLPGTPCALIHS